MIHIEQWDFNPEWRKYAFDKWMSIKPHGRVERIDDESISFFRERAEQAFMDLDFKYRYVKTFINVMLPEEGGGYAEGYPHVHYPLKGMSFIHYMDDSTTRLNFLVDDEIIETVYPKPGLTVFFPNDLSHGAYKHNEDRERVCLIAMAVV